MCSACVQGTRTPRSRHAAPRIARLPRARQERPPRPAEGSTPPGVRPDAGVLTWAHGCPPRPSGWLASAPAGPPGPWAPWAEARPPARPRAPPAASSRCRSRRCLPPGCRPPAGEGGAGVGVRTDGQRGPLPGGETGRPGPRRALHHGGAVGRHPGLPGACRPCPAVRPGAGQWGAAVAPRRSPVCGRAVPPQRARASLKDLGLAARGRARRGGRPERPPTPAHAAGRRGGQGCQRRRSPTRAGPGSRPGHAAAPQTRPRELRGSPRPRPAPDAHARHAEPSGRTRGTLAPACT